MAKLLDTVVSYVPDLAIRRVAAYPDRLGEPAIDSFEAAILLADVSGFTMLTETLAQRGPEGAEEMTKALNRYFSELIELISWHGGDIVKFAGDAILTLWQVGSDREDPLNALAEQTQRATQCALDMQRYFGKFEAIPDIWLSFKASIGAGPVMMAYLGGIDGRWEYAVMGPALMAMGPAAHHVQAGEVVLTPEAWKPIADRLAGESREDDCLRVLEVTQALAPSAEMAPDVPLEVEEALKSFLPVSVLARLEVGQADWLGEMRRLSVLFVNLPDLHHETPLPKAQAIVQALQTSMYRFEGSINKLSVDEKGISMVGALGLPPLSHHDDPERAIGAALAIHAKLTELGVRCSVGVTTGRAFCGEVGNIRRREYTVMGDVINLAARLMQAAKGSVRCDAPTYQAARRSYDFEAMPTIPLKGKTGLFALFQPLAKLQTRQAQEVTLVGRISERRRLGDLLHDFKQDQKAATLLIEGEAGLGKSALLGYATAQAAALKLAVFYASGDAIEQNSPYHPWGPVVRDLFAGDGVDLETRVLDRLRRDSEDLELAPLLNAILPLNLPETRYSATLEGAPRARITHELVARLMARAAGGKPVVVLDDAQWFDSASWALAKYVARSATPTLLVVGARPLPEVLPAAIAEALGPAAERLALAPLSAKDALRLACQGLGVSDLPGAAADAIVERAGGHPLFVLEMGYAIRDKGLLTITGDACTLAAGTHDMKHLELPSSVQGAVTSRIDHLAPAEQLTLKVASVLGKAFDPALLADVHPIADQKGEIPRHIARLIAVQLLATGEATTLVFKSAIAQDVAYNLLLPSQRKDVHRAVGQWHVDRDLADSDQHAALLAHHWSLADEWGAAAVCSERAGERAERIFALKEAQRFFREALDLDLRLPSGGDPRRRLRIEMYLGKVLKGMGEPKEARSYLNSALATARDLGDRTSEAQILTSSGHLHSIRNETAEAMEILQAADDLAAAIGDGAERIRALQHLARLHYRTGKPLEAIACSERAIALAKESPAPLDASAHQAFLGMLYVGVAVPEVAAAERIMKGIGLLEEAIATNRQQGDRRKLLDNLNLLGNALWMRGSYAEARAAFEETLAISAQMGAVYDTICARLNLAMQAHELGLFTAMEEQSRQACLAAQTAGYQDYALIALALQSLALSYLGKPEEGLAIQNDVITQLAALPEEARSGLEPTILPYLAEREYLCDRLAESLDFTERGWRYIEETGVREYEQRLLVLLGNLLCRMDREPEALQRFERALAVAEEVGSAAGMARAKLGLAILDRGAKDHEEAARLLAEAFGGATAARVRNLASEVAAEQGRLAAELGDATGARRYFEEALQWATATMSPSLEAPALAGLASLEARSTQ